MNTHYSYRSSSGRIIVCWLWWRCIPEPYNCSCLKLRTYSHVVIVELHNVILILIFSLLSKWSGWLCYVDPGINPRLLGIKYVTLINPHTHHGWSCESETRVEQFFNVVWKRGCKGRCLQSIDFEMTATIVNTPIIGFFELVSNTWYAQCEASLSVLECL